MNRRLASEGLGRLGIPADESRLMLLERYLDEIELWNPRYGLVHAAGDEVVIRHLLDSLSALPVLSEFLERPDRDAGFGLCDVGSGAGFPGIPLAVFLPDVPVTLIESSGRRVSFLKNAGALLGLTNLTVRETRAEDAARTGPQTAGTPPDRAAAGYAVVTFRAFKPLDAQLLATLGRLTAPGGWIAAYKGRRERLEAELAPLEGLITEQRIVPLEVPFLDEERHLVLLRPLPER